MANVSQYEGVSVLLYQDPSNPYESIYIRAEVENGCLTLSDEEIEHGPDGGSSIRIFTFDLENTQKVFDFLLEFGTDPFSSLKRMLTYQHRTKTFTDYCQARNIHFTSKLYF